MKCRYCEKVFSRIDSLNRHLNTIHADSQALKKEPSVSSDEIGDTSTATSVVDESEGSTDPDEEMEEVEEDAYLPDELKGWLFVVNTTLNDMELDKVAALFQDVNLYKDFARRLRKYTDNFISMAQNIDDGDIYDHLKKEEEQLLKKGYTKKEASIYPWENRSYLFKTLLKDLGKI